MSTSRRGTDLLLLLLIATFVVIGAAVFLVDPASRLGRSTQLLWGAIPTSAALWQFAYSRHERWRLWTNRMLLWLTNRRLTWGLSVEFEVGDERAALERVGEVLRSSMTEGDSVLSSADDTLVLQLGGLTVRARSDRYCGPDGEEEGLVKVDVPLAPRGFRDWRRAVDDTVPTLLERIERAISPTRQKHVARVRFEGANPYYGLFVNGVPEADLLKFDVEYTEHRPSADVIRVRKDQVQIVSGSVQSSRRQSMHYLGLQPIGEAA